MVCLGMGRDGLTAVTDRSHHAPSDSVVAASVANFFSRGVCLDIVCVGQDVEDFSTLT